MTRNIDRFVRSAVLIAAMLLASSLSAAFAAEVFTPAHVAKLRFVSDAQVSPDGKDIAYVLSVPRKPYEDDNGPAWAELHVIGSDGTSRPFITGEVNIGSVRWTPDGKGISFLAKRGKDKERCLYVIPREGGEARKVLSHESGVGDYDWSPDGKRVAFLAADKEPKEKKKLADKGFDAEIYEEELRPTHVWIGPIGDDAPKPTKLELTGSASKPHWSPTGDRIAVALAPTPLIDDTYMARKVHVVDVSSGKDIARIDNPGKLGDVAWSPDGKTLAMISAEDITDPEQGRLMVADASGGKPRDVLPNYEGHVGAIAWQDHDTVMFLGEEGVWTTFGEVGRDGSNRKTHIPTGKAVLSGLSLSRDGQTVVMRGESDRHPSEVFISRHGDIGPKRLTDSNPWLADMRFATQEVVTFKARDGLELQGLLIRPLDEQPGRKYPLILYVHGGPEAHDRNGWSTAYSRPGQVAAAQGFAVFNVNYRGSTGRGVAFSKLGQADPAGKEFDDLVDAVDHLVKVGLVDPDRVGVTGGSYGGYATGWCATYYTERFAAGVMFVGISDKVSKAGTTDIPNEEFYVHARKRIWEDWKLFQDRSPIRYVEKARTPLLILGGKDDTRVHPSQSLSLYRYLKVLGQVPVRLVRYPGEGHGNRRSASRYDYNLRMMQWFNHYLVSPGTRETPPPPAELGYGFKDKEEGKDKDDGKDGDSEAFHAK